MFDIQFSKNCVEIVNDYDFTTYKNNSFNKVTYYKDADITKRLICIRTDYGNVYINFEHLTRSNVTGRNRKLSIEETFDYYYAEFVQSMKGR